MSHMINLYKLTSGHVVKIQMEHIQEALTSLTSEDWSDYFGGDVSVNFKDLEPIQVERLQSTKKKSFFSRKSKSKEIAFESNEQEIDADENSIAFIRPQKGFENAMFELMNKLELIAIRDESFAEIPEAILSTFPLTQNQIPAEIDTMPTKDMRLIHIKTPDELLRSLHDPLS